MKSPSFQFYPADYLASQRVQMMTLEEEGAYVRLLLFCWTHGSIPSDSVKAARLVGKGCTQIAAEEVLRMFDVHPEDSSKMIHPRLEREREKQTEWREKSSQAGKKGAASRWHNQTITNPIALVKPTLQPNYDSSVCSLPSPLGERKTTVPAMASPSPTLREAESFGRTLVPPCEGSDILDWWEGQESRGWVDGQQVPIKAWKPYLTKWWRVRFHSRQEKAAKAEARQKAKVEKKPVRNGAAHPPSEPALKVFPIEIELPHPDSETEDEFE